MLTLDWIDDMWPSNGPKTIVKTSKVIVTPNHLTITSFNWWSFHFARWLSYPKTIKSSGNINKQNIAIVSFQKFDPRSDLASLVMKLLWSRENYQALLGSHERQTHNSHNLLLFVSPIMQVWKRVCCTHNSRALGSFIR